MPQNITMEMTKTFITQLQFCSFLAFFSSLPVSILNILTIIAILKSANLQTNSNILILSLSMTDAITGGISIPMYGANLYKQSKMQNVCIIGYISYQISAPLAVISVVSVSGIALERYIALFYPYFYQRHVTKRRVLVGISIVWAVVIFIYLISFAIGNSAPSSSLSGIVMIFGLIWNAFVYIKIFKMVRRIQRQIQVENIPASTVTVENNHRQQESAEKRLNIFTAVIIAVIFLSYMPFLCVKFVTVSITVDSNVKQLADMYTNMILLINSLMNPMVYFVQNPPIKRAVVALMPTY